MTIMYMFITNKHCMYECKFVPIYAACLLFLVEGRQQLQREGLHLWQMSIGAWWRHVPRDRLPSLSCRHVGDYSRLTALPPQPSWISVWTTL